jgi:hypothetical protein
MHGSLYGKFKCAMCESAAAGEQAITAADGGDGPDVAQARLVGYAASEFQRERAEAGLRRIANDHGRMPLAQREDELRGQGRDQPNLVADLADAIRREAPDKGFPRVDRQTFDSTERPEEGAVSLDAIAAVVRLTFTAIQPMPPSDGSIIVATGALLMGIVVADQSDGENERIDPREVNVLPPWEVKHPALLDPVIWLLATAYNFG